MDKRLDYIDLFVLDMDGTFYLGEQMIEGSLDFLAEVKKTGKRAIFFTNNSSKDKKLYVEKLARMGCFVGEQDIMTSGDVTIAFLKKERPGKKVYLVGTPALERSFIQAGIELSGRDEQCDIVVVGFDMTLTYEKLERACTFIRNGAEFVATHPDINCPTENGFIPDCGAFIAAISLSTGVKPRILGKPYTETADMVASVYNTEKKHIAFVGDRLYTDVACGVNNGATGILVLSGETRPEDLAVSETRPDFVFDRLSSMVKEDNI